MSVADIDLSSPEFWAQADPERDAAFARLRAEAPISFFEEMQFEGDSMPPGPGYWALTRYADVWHVSRHPDLFQSGKGVNIPDLPVEIGEFFGSMIAMDAPRHSQLRGLVQRGFTPRHIKQIDEHIDVTAARIVDGVAAKGECDFVTEIAAQLPLQIICDMLGIPASQHQRIFELTNIILGVGDPEYATSLEELMAGAMELFQYAMDLGQQRLDDPTDDITSALMHAELDGQRLSTQEFGSFIILLVAAGNETTRNAISHGMKLLTDHPDQRKRWMTDFDAVAPTAVDEIVRLASPVIHFRRTATQDTEIAGQPIKEGEKVVMWYGSANRDDAKFPDPNTFDVLRPAGEQVGFGAGGPHFCLGANLARREMTAMFRELFTRLPDIEITGPPDMLQSSFIHGIKRMPCAFTPVG
ncbi:MAG: methyl-branched lipid omega-hydroxylase [Actinomycetota bacterium]|nr:methyl-branched lipid omega-hydroxylase [Actinomycetota bacterium]